MILHYIISPYETSAGVQKKINQQIEALNIHNIQVEKLILPPISLPSFTGSIQKIFGFPLLFLIVLCNDYYQNLYLIRLFQTLPSDHAIYMRMPVPSLMTWIFFKKNQQRMIIVEHQSRELREYLVKGNFLYPLLDWIFGGAIRSYISIQIAVTSEVIQYQMCRNPQRKVTQFLVISNGIDTNIAPVRTLVPTLNKSIEMIFLGDIKYWHGIDRMISGLEHYSGVYNISFIIYGHNSHHTTQLSRINNPKVQVQLYPFVSGIGLNQIFETAHIAISSLGVHRIRIKEISSLKSREYCSRGIPFIFSTADPDFSHNFPYALEFPADNNPIQIEQIFNFLEEIYQDDKFSHKMHEYAEYHLKWAKKLQPLAKILHNQSKPPD
jgi:hypothetical protein